MKLVKKLPIMLNVDVCVHFYEGLFPPCDKTSHVTIATLVFASVVLSKREMRQTPETHLILWQKNPL